MLTIASGSAPDQRERLLEAALLEYVRRFGVTDSARQALTFDAACEPRQVGLTLRLACQA